MAAPVMKISKIICQNLALTKKMSIKIWFLEIQ